MKFSRLSGAIITLSLLTISANANPSTLYTTAYNFPLDSSGGGAAAQLDGANIEIFCVDFAHQIWVPYGPPVYPGYQVNVSNLSTGANLSLTRFGGVTSWSAVNIAGDATDTNIINNANALARYQMAAYLVMQYHVADSPTNNAYNDSIQEAIWTIMDPTGNGTLPTIADPTAKLQAAAQWYASGESDKSFLANFHIISDTAMTNCGAGPMCGGFQEQLFDPPAAVPEPRAQFLVILGVLSMAAFAYQRKLKKA